MRADAGSPKEYRLRKNESNPVSRKPDEHLATIALEAAQDGIWDLDYTSGRIYISTQWKALLGFGASDLSDNPEEWFSRIHQDDLSAVKKLLKKNLERKTACFRSEHRIQHADGTYRWFLARGAMVTQMHGTTSTRIAGTLTDITERKQHEVQLMLQLDELRFALASEKVLMEELDRKNKELTELSITDGLTGLYNHRYLQDRFDYEFKRVRRYGGMLSCIIIDIDHFKSLNDTYGHQYGDYVIKEIASLIRTRSREVDICGRYGGEEFMVLSNLPEKNAFLYATKLHDAIENHRFEHPSAQIKVTVSMGIAEYNNEIRMKQELIERADRAMYQAKNNGRNLVCLWRDVSRSDSFPVNTMIVRTFRNRLKTIALELFSKGIDAMGEVVDEMETRLPNASGHARNVARYSSALAMRMGLPAEQIETIRLGAFLHDIGKVCIVHSHDEKSSVLPDAEVIARHPDIGASLLKEIRLLERELPIVLYHHERFDGKGYPHRLRGREIPIEARIVSVANSLDTLLNGRGSERKISIKKAFEIINRGRGTRYCPDVLDVFNSMDEFEFTGISKPERGKRGDRHELHHS